MKEQVTITGKIKSLLTVFLPIFIAQVAFTSTGFFDTVMSGQAGETQLAGVAVGTNIWAPVFVGMVGVIGGLTPIFAQKFGARKMEELSSLLMQAVYLAVLMTVFVLGLGFALVDVILSQMTLDAEVERVTRGYLLAIGTGILPMFVVSSMRNYIDAQGFTRISMIITLICVPFNILMNWLLIFGKWGFPALGGVGAGVASSLMYWLALILAVGVLRCMEPFKGQKVFRLPRCDVRAWLDELKTGLPIGGSIFVEMSIFCLVGLLITEYGTSVIAAHQSALNFSSFIYMIPLSIGSAMTILVGFEVGAGRNRDAKVYTRIGICMALAIACCTAVSLMSCTREVAYLYTSEEHLIPILESFLVYAVFFQVSDAVAAPIQGALRGYKDVTVTMVMAIIAYWVIGLPVGYLLAQNGYDAYGYWVGFITGIAVSAVLLFLRMRYLQKNKFPVM